MGAEAAQHLDIGMQFWTQEQAVRTIALCVAFIRPQLHILHHRRCLLRRIHSSKAVHFAHIVSWCRAGHFMVHFIQTEAPNFRA